MRMKVHVIGVHGFASKVLHLILTGLQPGDSEIVKEVNRFNGFTVSSRLSS